MLQAGLFSRRGHLCLGRRHRKSVCQFDAAPAELCSARFSVSRENTGDHQRQTASTDHESSLPVTFVRHDAWPYSRPACADSRHQGEACGGTEPRTPRFTPALGCVRPQTGDGGPPAPRAFPEAPAPSTRCCEDRPSCVWAAAGMQ